MTDGVNQPEGLNVAGVKAYEIIMGVLDAHDATNRG